MPPALPLFSGLAQRKSSESTGAAFTKMSTRMRTSGTTRMRQKPNMSHLLKMSRRALRRSKSVAANGFVMVAAVMSRLVGLLDSLDDEVGGDVDAARDDEQHDAQDEEHAIMVVAMNGLAHLRRDGGRHGAHRVGEGQGNPVAVSS